jgi:hypothetical protein
VSLLVIITKPRPLRSQLENSHAIENLGTNAVSKVYVSGVKNGFRGRAVKESHISEEPKTELIGCNFDPSDKTGTKFFLINSAWLADGRKL